MKAFFIKLVAWKTHEASLRSIREQVFIVEQKVPVALEWDDLDKDAMHLLAYDDNDNAIGCARVLQHGSIGRMAVLKAKRRLGVGHALLSAAIKLCRAQQLNRVILSAQTHAISFYEKAGFIVVSEAYLDANILHVDMQLKI